MINKVKNNEEKTLNEYVEEREAQVYTYEIWPMSKKRNLVIWTNAETSVTILTPGTW